MIILLVSNATHFASRISLHVRATLKSEMTWRDLPFSYVSWWDFYDDFYDRGTPDMKRVIYSLVADVPVSPVWCVFATSVCQPKCVPARVQQQRSVLLCASAGFTLSQWSISPQTINTLLIVFSPHLLCPYITPKTPVMSCCKDIEKKEKENGSDSGCERSFWNIPTLLRRCRYRRAHHSPRERLKSKLFVKTP